MSLIKLICYGKNEVPKGECRRYNKRLILMENTFCGAFKHNWDWQRILNTNQLQRNTELILNIF